MNCPRCKRELAEGAKVCHVCGMKLSAYRAINYCKTCGKLLKPGVTECPACKLAKEQEMAYQAVNDTYQSETEAAEVASVSAIREMLGEDEISAIEAIDEEVPAAEEAPVEEAVEEISEEIEEVEEIEEIPEEVEEIEEIPEEVEEIEEIPEEVEEIEEIPEEVEEIEEIPEEIAEAADEVIEEIPETAEEIDEFITEDDLEVEAIFAAVNEEETAEAESEETVIAPVIFSEEEMTAEDQRVLSDETEPVEEAVSAVNSIAESEIVSEAEEVTESAAEAADEDESVAAGVAATIAAGAAVAAGVGEEDLPSIDDLLKMANVPEEFLEEIEREALADNILTDEEEVPEEEEEMIPVIPAALPDEDEAEEYEEEYEELEDVEEIAPEKEEKKKKRWPIWLLLLLLLLLLGGLGIWAMNRNNEESAPYKGTDDPIVGSAEHEIETPETEETEEETETEAETEPETEAETEPETEAPTTEAVTTEAPTTEAPTTAAPVVDEQAIHRYEVVIADVSFDQARADAAARGGHLARIANEAEFTAIVNQIGAEGKANCRLFIGAGRDAASDDYFWMNGDGSLTDVKLNDASYWTASHWLPGDPSYVDRGFAETVIMLHPYNGGYYLNDVENNMLAHAQIYSGTVGYIVEYDQ